MNSFSVILKESVNDIPFFTKKSKVRAILGMPQSNTKEERKMTPETQRAMDLMEIVLKETYQRIGKDPDTFEWPDLSPYVSDRDIYGKYQLEYDTNDCLISATLIAEYVEHLICCGKDFSDFDLKKFLSLSNDFIEEENGASYVSYSLQIGIYCPDMDGRIENITFGSEGYFQSDDEETEKN